ncbi:MAG: response regulator, partial [Rhodoferax sp.]|nr:response regulator [Rhodoferax sp.]
AGLLGDATRIRQALLNYAGNAIKFTERGVVSLHAMLVEQSATSALLRFEVRDTGMGIAAERSGKLFTPFEQGDNTLTRQYGGTGLGLAITKKLAEAMGGAVGVTSTPGEGSSFWFTARLRKGPALLGLAAAPAEPNPMQALQRAFAGRRILMAEDDTFNQEIGRIVLEDAGLVVDMANDGNAAVAMAAARAYDLVLMDMQMPHLDGLDATRQIRQMPGGQGIPIVAMTANAFAEDRTRCIEAGMNDFVTKPIDPQVLYQALLRWLRPAAHP